MGLFFNVDTLLTPLTCGYIQKLIFLWFTPAAGVLATLALGNVLTLLTLLTKRKSVNTCRPIIGVCWRFLFALG